MQTFCKIHFKAPFQKKPKIKTEKPKAKLLMKLFLKPVMVIDQFKMTAELRQL